MTPRISYRSKPAYKAMLALEQAVVDSGMDKELLDLVRLRASQINGCAFCINLHGHDLKKAGVADQRIWLLNAWREAPVFSDRERAALEWTESVTLIANDRVPDDVYERVRAQFSEDEIVQLTLAIVAINGWNRFGVALRSAVPVDTPKQAAVHAEA